MSKTTKRATLTPSQADALRVVQSVWPDKPRILIGASALACHIDISYRSTFDIDFAVSVDAEDFGAEFAALDGWRRHETMEHRFFAPSGQMLDVLPASPTLLAQEEVIWPSGAKMSLVGFDLAFAHASSLPVHVAGAKTDLSVMVPMRSRHRSAEDAGLARPPSRESQGPERPSPSS